MLFLLKHIRYAYGQKKAVDDFSLEFARGRFYGLMGPNGCGKSTLLDLLVRHKTPDSGDIFFLGKPMESYSGKRFAREIALVPQTSTVNFPFTAREIVMMGRYPHIPRFSQPAAADREIVAAVMRQTGTGPFENRLITELSGGERQRVILARALAQDASILLLDEATSNLDISHTLGMLKRIKRGVVHDGKTVIAVFQDINLATMFCDDLIFMKDGRLVDFGPIGEVLSEATLRDVFQVAPQITWQPFTRSQYVFFRGLE